MNGDRRFTSWLLALLVVLGGCGSGSDQADPFAANGPAEAGLPGGLVPTASPALLAPGLVNTGMNTRDVTMTPDGREMYFCMAAPGYRYAVILVTRLEDGQWTEPEVAPFSGSTEWIDLEPFVSPDGKRLYFMSTRPEAGQDIGEADLWIVDRQGDHWGQPRNLGAPVNSDQAEYFPAVTEDGSLYFTRADSTGRVHRIYRARPGGEGYLEPDLLPAEVNCGTNRFNATVTPDEGMVILSAVGVPGSFGVADYFLIRRDEQDRWYGPFNLGPVINDGSAQSWSPYLTPDGKTFCFMSSRRTFDGPGWPPAWGALQANHRQAGGGSPNIFLVRADFLDTVGIGTAGPAKETPISELRPQASNLPFPVISGPYLGQEPPGTDPVVFAPGIVSTGLNERDLLISADGQTIWYGFMGQGLVTIMETRLEDGRWTEPVPVPFHRDPEFACFEPTLSRDGATVLFLSNRAAPGQEQGPGWANQNIFRSRQVDGTWSEPAALPAPVTTPAAEYFPSLATDGTLYFSREDGQGHSAIWAAEPEGEGYADPVLLSAAVNVGQSNYNATVAPDESWIILCVTGHHENLGTSDYWVSFRGDEGNWLPAVNLGEKFNGPGLRAASVSQSPDGRYLFFSSNRSNAKIFFPNDRVTRQGLLGLHASWGNGSTDIWWVDATVIKSLR
jgi:Tol biopolymer transport system component